MKSFLLLITFFIGSFQIDAQINNQSKIQRHIFEINLPYSIPVLDPEIIPVNNTNPFVSAQNQTYRNSITSIGSTTYDLQSNSTVQNRIVNNGGNISAIWTTSASGTLGAPDRGTGYNFYNGSTWLSPSSTRIETTRTGWPSMMSGTTNSEIIINHNFGTNPLNILKRNTAGTGTWNASTIAGLASGEFAAWPRAVVGGSNNSTIHLMSITLPSASGGSIYNGMDGSIVYSRSLNEGVTWDIQHISPPGMNSSNYASVSADSYAIDSKGDVVAMVSGGFTQDLAIWKSLDNGSSWLRTVVQAFPIPAFPSTGLTTDVDGDGIADTVNTDDGSVALLIDNNNMVHVWAGAMRVLKTDPAATGINYFPGTDGLYYWNESMGVDPPIIIAGALDLDGNGMLDIVGIANYQLGITTMPNAGIDAAGNLFCVYSSLVENTSNGLTPAQSYRNIYAIASNDGGATWGSPYNVSDSNFDEGVFASIARNVDNDLHIIWQSDTEPGLAVRGDMDPFTLNDILYTTVPKSSVVGIQDLNTKINSLHLFPNPATDKARISFELLSATSVSINVVNMMGQVVISEQQLKFRSGIQFVDLSIDELNSGIYFVNIQIADQQFSRKMIKL